MTGGTLGNARGGANGFTVVQTTSLLLLRILFFAVCSSLDQLGNEVSLPPLRVANRLESWSYPTPV